MNKIKEIELLIRASSQKSAIINILKKEGYLHQTPLATKLKVSNSTIREHLEKLIKMGVIKKTTASKYAFYSLTDFGKVIADEIII